MGFVGGWADVAGGSGRGADDGWWLGWFLLLPVVGVAELGGGVGWCKW